MTIDWFTLLAQIINFVVLLWLLKKFLFGRIVQAMKDRETAIANQLAEAERLRLDAAQEAEAYRKKLRELDRKRENLLAEAQEQAALAKAELLTRAEMDANSARALWKRDLEREQTELHKDFRVNLGQQVLRTTQNVVRELADADLQQLLLKKFLSQLLNLPDAAKAELVSAIQSEGNRVQVLSSFELDSSGRDSVVDALHQSLSDQRLSPSIQVEFGPLSNESIGIEVRTTAHCIPWTLDGYLEELEERILPTLRQGKTSYAG